MPLWIQDMISREGGNGDTLCTKCDNVQATWRCLDCLGRLMYCTSCFRHRHKHLPFHRVENWTGSFFKAAWLCQAGLELHLGHKGDQCPANAESDLYYTENEDTTEGVELEVDNGDDGLDADVVFTETESRAADNFTPDLEGSDDANDDGWESEDHDHLRPRFRGGDYGNGLPYLEGGNVIIFVDTSGVHRLRVHYCRCPNAKHADRQFVEMGFLPASVMKPKTAFTFRVLDDFRLTNLECNTAGTSYWHKIVRKTSNVFRASVPVGVTSVPHYVI